jgi:hypothetical protein
VQNQHRLGKKTNREGRVMESPLKGKRILAVDDEPDILTILDAEIKEASPSSTVDD